MKNNQLVAALAGVFLLCALWNAYLVYQYRESIHGLQNAQARVNYVTRAGAVLQSLLNDTVQYSKKNPAINPILQSVTNGAVRAAEPAGKPASK